MTQADHDALLQRFKGVTAANPVAAGQPVFDTDKAIRILESVGRGNYPETGAKAAGLLPQEFDAWIESGDTDRKCADHLQRDDHQAEIRYLPKDAYIGDEEGSAE